MRYSKKISRRKVGDSAIDMSSLMDIIFILLIFVMMRGSFAKNFTQLEIDLPKSQTGTSELSPDVQISIKVNEKIYLEEKEITLDELSNFASQGNFRDKVVSVNVERKVSYESFLQVVDILKQARIKKLNLGTE